MSDPLADTMSMVDDWERNATEKAARFQTMADRVAEVMITASVAEGAVSATVGHNGIPTDIAMTERVLRMAPDEIAANVMAAIRKAQSQYPQVLASIVAETVGDDPAGQHIVATAEQNFPPPPDDGPAEAETGTRIGDVEEEDEVPPPRRRPRASTNDGDDTDDFGDDSVFR